MLGLRGSAARSSARSLTELARLTDDQMASQADTGSTAVELGSRNQKP